MTYVAATLSSRPIATSMLHHSEKRDRIRLNAWPQDPEFKLNRRPSSDSAAAIPDWRRQWRKVSRSPNSTEKPSSISALEVWLAERPLGSVAVTSTVAPSGAPELILSVSPSMDTDTTDVSEATAV